MPLNQPGRIADDAEGYIASEVDYVAMRVDANHDISDSLINLVILPDGDVPQDDTTWHAADDVERPTPTSVIGRILIGPGTLMGKLPSGIYRQWMQVVDNSVRPAVPADRPIRIRD
jgi:hypothetical protein